MESKWFLNNRVHEDLLDTLKHKQARTHCNPHAPVRKLSPECVSTFTYVLGAFKVLPVFPLV